MEEEKLAKLWEGLILTEVEEEPITVAAQDIMAATQRGKNCLLAKVITERYFNNEALRSTMTQVWRNEGGMTFTEIGENSFMLECEKEIDKQKILQGRPWNFDRNLIGIQDIDSSLPPSEVSFSHEPFWVQIHNVPFAGMTAEYGKQIGSSVGKVLSVEVDKVGQSWGRCLGKWLQVGERRTWAAFKYERLQNFCFMCGVIMHQGRGCPLQKPQEDQQNQYGHWLRAMPPKVPVGASKTYGGRPTTTTPDLKWQHSGMVDINGPRLARDHGDVSGPLRQEGEEVGCQPAQDSMAEEGGVSHHHYRSKHCALTGEYPFPSIIDIEHNLISEVTCNVAHTTQSSPTFSTVGGKLDGDMTQVPKSIKVKPKFTRPSHPTKWPKNLSRSKQDLGVQSNYSITTRKTTWKRKARETKLAKSLHPDESIEPTRKRASSAVLGDISNTQGTKRSRITLRRSEANQAYRCDDDKHMAEAARQPCQDK
ncbi:uncharacterized protein LOC122274396 [Carya illinoinensis]|uniref:uncharacterized protein LOC122274396 n=1 Tax=Carya illinoinensis TaxID=32201 RepID=UPI001C71CE73|nr:uncharacterized protein LOC122274396 [Carya illinoinensis]